MPSPNVPSKTVDVDLFVGDEGSFRYGSNGGGRDRLDGV